MDERLRAPCANDCRVHRAARCSTHLRSASTAEGAFELLARHVIPPWRYGSRPSAPIRKAGQGVRGCTPHRSHGKGSRRHVRAGQNTRRRPRWVGRCWQYWRVLDACHSLSKTYYLPPRSNGYGGSVKSLQTPQGSGYCLIGWLSCGVALTGRPGPPYALAGTPQS